MIDVIYLAAGQGKRAKLGYPKQFARLGGKPIMIHALEVFQKISEINKIIIAYPDDNRDIFAGKIMPYVKLDNIKFVMGGKTRQESVKKALEFVSTKYVLIHEAVRPFITKEFIQQIISMEGEAITPYICSLSSTLRVAGNGFIPREEVGQVQMPQKFNTAVLKQAHEKAKHMNYTDDSYLIWAEIGTVLNLLPGLEENIKITTPLDLVIAEAIYTSHYNTGE
jgi:2-C-methyl-D-erythritol 4-phosphate cytidylyltransferase